MAGRIDLALDSLPEGARCRSVSARPGEHSGRRGLRVALLEEVREHGKPRVDYVDQPTFVVLPLEVEAARVEVDLASELLPDAPDWARGFAGVAFAIAADMSTYESVYVRPANGMHAVEQTLRSGAAQHIAVDWSAAEALRTQRAVQYYAYPDWPFDILRDRRPDEGFEAGADIDLGRWLHVMVEFDGEHVRAEIDGVEVINRGRIGTPLSGAIGLWVDIGTDAHFANLSVTRLA